MNELLLIVGMALVTFAVRYPVLVLVGRLALPQPVLRALKYVPLAALAAIIAPAMLLDAGGQLDIRPENAHLLAGVVAFVVAWRSKSILLTIVLGMATFWGVRLLTGTL